MLLAIHHAQIMIPPGGEPAAREFYGRLLGLAEIAKPAHLAVRGGLWFSVGGLELHLGVDENETPSARAHLAYQVLNLDAARAALHAAGVATKDSAEIDGYRRCELRDPFGNRIELVQRV